MSAAKVMWWWSVIKWAWSVMMWFASFFGRKGDDVVWVIASAANYRQNFWKAVWTKLDWYQVHHSLPQKYQNVFEAVGLNIHENKYLRWVPEQVHYQITSERRKFDSSLWWAPSIGEITSFARQIDANYWKFFVRAK
jgi:hypothetical protein